MVFFPLNHHDSHNPSTEEISVLPGHSVANIYPENIHGFVPPATSQSCRHSAVIASGEVGQSHRESGQSPGGQGRVPILPCNLCLRHPSTKCLPNVGTLHMTFLLTWTPSCYTICPRRFACPAPCHSVDLNIGVTSAGKPSLAPPGKDSPFLDTLRVPSFIALKTTVTTHSLCGSLLFMSLPEAARLTE